jgi:hypothetical protein
MFAGLFQLQVLKFFPNEDKHHWMTEFENAAKTPHPNEFRQIWSTIVSTLYNRKTKGFFDNVAPNHWANSMPEGHDGGNCIIT